MTEGRTVRKRGESKPSSGNRKREKAESESLPIVRMPPARTPHTAGRRPSAARAVSARNASSTCSNRTAPAILADMYYREFAPGEDAGRFVERYWVLEDAAPGTVQRVVPDGRPELILNLGQPFESLQNGLWERQPRCFLAGQLTGPLHLRAPGTTRILGVRFRPGGAAQLLGMPMQELTDRVVPASDLGLKSLAERATLPDVERALLEAGARPVPTRWWMRLHACWRAPRMSLPPRRCSASARVSWSGASRLAWEWRPNTSRAFVVFSASFMPWRTPAAAGG